MLHDLRLAIRTLRKARGYSATALLVIALGVGANTTIFSLVDTMLLRPLPYPHADQLYVPVSINVARQIERGSVSYADYEDWRRERDLFEAVAVFQAGSATLSGHGTDAERAESLLVSEDYFRLTAVQPLAGRVLLPSDQTQAGSRVAVIGYSLWQRRFGGDPAVVGRTVRIGDVPHEVVGVLPPRATYPEDTQLFLPLVPPRFATADLARRDNMIFQAIARLRDGVTREEADARLHANAARVERENPSSRKGWTNGLIPVREYIIEPELQIALYVLLAAVGAVLLIACANLANLTLVRGAGRAREIGVRFAIGASRLRLVRHLLAESVVLGVAGGAIGIAFAAAAVHPLIAAIPPDAPFIQHVAIDARVMTAALLLTLFTVVVVGVAPALTASGLLLTTALREGARGASAGTRTGRLRGALVVAEIAAAVMLLVTAGLLVRSLDRLMSSPPGADIHRVLAAQIGVPGSRYAPPARIEFFRTLIQRLSSEPGVQAAAATSYLPVGGGGFGLGRVFLGEGHPEPPAGPDVPVMWMVVTPDYFRALGIPLVSGRVFDDNDRRDSRPVMIVSQSFAVRLFPNQSAIGQRARSWRDENVYREIVGVVADVPFSSLADRDRAIVYVPHAQQGWGNMAIVLRAAAGSPVALTNTLRRTVAAVDPEIPLWRVGAMDLFAREAIARERLSAMLLSVLAAAALALAVLGIYGVMSYAVAQRRQEMGVRLALGAAPADLYRLVLGGGLRLTATGLIIGLALAFGAAQAISRLLYQTRALDPFAFGGMALVLGVTAVIACYLPARRAASADPLAALREM